MIYFLLVVSIAVSLFLLDKMIKDDLNPDDSIDDSTDTYMKHLFGEDDEI